jgi:hypothetical protein
LIKLLIALPFALTAAFILLSAFFRAAAI